MINNSFYRSDVWRRFREYIINERLSDSGETICEYCGNAIVDKKDIILHHKEELMDDNVDDANISLNPDNIMVIHHKCHNIIHNKLGYKDKKVYLVYGPPCAGKSTWVNDMKNDNDIVVDMNAIWKSITTDKSVSFGLRDYLFDCIKYRRGRWRSAYIVGGYPLISDRERLIKELGCEEVYVECNREECIKRGANEEYVDDWFDKYGPPRPN